MSQTETGSRDCGTGPRGEPIYEYTFKTNYYAFQKERMLELRESATETGQFKSSSGCSAITETWSPEEPRVEFNDPNLP
jgi:hypothetical protein